MLSAPPRAWDQAISRQFWEFLLAGIGVVMLVRSVVAAVADGDGIGRIDVWLLARVLAAVAAFALLLNPLGLVLTAVIVVVVASWAGHEFRLGEALINGAALALLSYLLFIRALGQPCRFGRGSFQPKFKRLIVGTSDVLANLALGFATATSLSNLPIASSACCSAR